MAKIRAVLDQETWAEVDVADEYQAITNSLYFEESVDGGDSNDALNSIARSENKTVSSSSSLIADGEVTNSAQPINRTNSTEVSPDITAQVNVSSSTGPVDNSRTDGTSSAPTNSASKKDRTLIFRGVGYHMVNW